MDTGWWKFIDGEMRARNWSIPEFARKTDINPSLVSNWKNKGFQPSIEVLRRIAEGMGIPMLTLLVESGHIDSDEAGGKVPVPPAMPPIDVVAAVKADPHLIPEAKAHLIDEYELLLRIESQPSTQHSPGLRAVARKTGRRGNGRG